MSIIKELNWRELVKQITNEEKIKKAEKENSAVYCGFDPTADSLHVGHLMMIVTLRRFQLSGFVPIAVIGGGTGMIGDPSFKSNERVLQTVDQVKKNMKAIERQIKSIISKDVVFENNANWLNKMSLIDFLRDVGKDFTLSYLLAKESIATRIETGLSITEFSYTMLQAYDFYHLYSNNKCWVQIGGSDQWGNITSGIDYIGSKIGRANSNAAGFTIPLLTKADGTKFGKTESGAVWLDQSKTSEYEFYQFWLNQDDAGCEKMLKFLTFLSQKEIEDIVKKHSKAPHERHMQKALASEVTLFVHKKAGLEKAQNITDAMFKGELASLDKKQLEIALSSIPTINATKDTLFVDAIIQVGLASSKREAREFLAAKAIMANDIVIEDETLDLSKINVIYGKYIILKRGKKKYFAIILN